MKNRWLKICSLALVTAMVFTLAACGGGNGGSGSGGGEAAPAPAANASGSDSGDVAADEATFSLRLSEVHSGDGHPAIIGHNEFARLANENSDGTLNIELFSGGVLGSETEVMAQVQAGAIEMIRLPVPVITGIDERFNALFLPGIWNSRDAMFAALDGQVGETFAEMLKDHNMYILAWHDAGARSIYNSVRPVVTPDDLSGLRIRMQEAQLMIDLMNALGGVPVPMPPGEVYAAIQTGVVDGAENNWPSYVTSFSHHEVAGFFTDNEHSRVPEAVIISLNVWNSLSANQQEVLRQAAIDGATAQRTAWAEVEVEAEAEAVAAGVEVTRLTPEQRQAFNDLLTPLWDDWTHLQEYIDIIVAAQR